nr:MAG TPA: tail sheath protein [Caudoviricetes sp.]
MGLDVKVKIDLNKPLGKTAFGNPLILSVGAEEKACTECKTIEDIVTAGYAQGTDTYKAAQLMLSQNNPPEKVLVCTATNATAGLQKVAGEAWRQLVVVGELPEEQSKADIASWIEATKDKMYFATVETAAELSALGEGKRTIGFVHKDPVAVAALVGEAAGREVGSFTYKNLILNGIEPMTDIDVDAVTSAKGITFVTKAGDNVTSEGKVLADEYIDIIDSEDYIITNLENRTQKALNNVGKIPYDNNGIAMLESVAVNVMMDAYSKGMIATDADGNAMYEVDYALREETSEEDRAIRKYVGGRFKFTLAGAVHEVQINGEIAI